MIDARLPVRAFFTDRHGGLSAQPYDSLNLSLAVGDDPGAVDMNRARVADIADADVVFMRPEHGIAVAHVDARHARGLEVPLADVLVTTTPGLGIATLAADCVPLLIHDAVSGAVAAVHVGREGLYKGVVDAAMAALVDLRGGWRDSAAITAAIGPAICGRCYGVTRDMRDRVVSRHPVAMATTGWGAPALHIPRAVEARLQQLGIDRVLRHRRCTFQDSSLFSYRREGATGRMAGVAVCAAP